MKLFDTASHFYLMNGDSILKCCKATKKLSVHCGDSVENANELGEFVAFIGKLDVENECYLLIAAQCTPVATYPCTNVWKFENFEQLLDTINHIDRAVAIPVEKDGLLSKLHSSPSKLEKIKSSQKKVMRYVTGKGSSVRLIDEILRLFNVDGGFYISFKHDITLSTQSMISTKKTNKWFFWNYALLADLYDDNGFSLPGANKWIVPICQGFVAERKISIEAEPELSVTLISRRCVNRAGVRYLKRGIDEDGDVANFVETEVILTVFGHCLSFVQVRGSVPIFWTQHGYRYRPPLVISKLFNESYPAFAKHIYKLCEAYGSPITLVDLVEQRGREMQLGESFLRHVLRMDSPDVAYFAFDFHFRCRGLRFCKVAELISALSDQISTIGFCWVDKTGEIICEQRGVIRTNCVDCLDRTNVVQVQKLGIVGPQTDAPIELIQALQMMWADNGDAISRQYAGTDALKGDVTRSGQRNLVGIVRDSYNSASRYYLSHMRDAQRQLAIDACLGKSFKSVEPQCEQLEVEEEEEVESIGRLVHETVLFIISEKEVLVGGWALVEGSNDGDQIDTVLLLTKSELVITSYDDDTKLLDVKRISFGDIRSLECGRISRSSRIHLRLNTKSGEQYSWRAAKTRLFNNVAIALRNEDEANEYVQAIGEQIKVTMALAGRVISLTQVPVLSTPGRIDRNKKKVMNVVASIFRHPGEDHERPYISKNEPTVFSKLNENDSNIVPVICASEFDGRLVDKSGPIISSLQKMKQSVSGSLCSGVSSFPRNILSSQNPLFQYRQQILDSKSLIVLL